MKGIQYIVDETGEKTAVVIDLKEWGQLWNEFYQNLLDRSPVNEDWINRSPFREKLDPTFRRLKNTKEKTEKVEQSTKHKYSRKS
ncbi:hypothetical protein myaer102_22880 [Microcystis viridis NIES-102]|jgi:hypothetical protein|uniref:Uncharacterized protein n=1 Tax=Microcystis viridis NIES-102 TaxID=213615 RepID=A0A3G9K3E0_MICVR|nr:hypothetical protein [Microcystis viridis]BBH39745.1 hypothetical protein myaer102_22880 [Microcystis viridis NIES-102]